MPVISISVTRRDLGWKDIKKNIRGSKNAVYVGVFSAKGEPLNKISVDGAEPKPSAKFLNKLLLVKIATVHEFGAIISHPGGTAYGYATKAAQLVRRIRFLRKGKGILVLGVTPPHLIKIPQRSFIRSTFNEKKKEIINYGRELLVDILNNRMNKVTALNLMGIFLQNQIRLKIKSNIPPPNAYSTRKKKKSTHTLIDTGRLINAISWDVREH